MDKIIANNSLSQSDYWNLITSTLSSYEVKDISPNGEVTIRVANDDYFLANDVWNVNYIGQIPNFKEQFNKYKGLGKNLKFSTKYHNIVLELKFVLYHKLFNDELGLNSLFHPYRTSINNLFLFLNEKHPHLHSLLDLDVEKTEKQWIWWLNNKGVKTAKIIKNIQYGEYETKSVIALFFRSIYEKLFDLTDNREEWEKDRWDIRVLHDKYGMSYNTSRTNFYIDFTSIQNVIFRQYLKKYIKTRLLGGGRFSWGSAENYLRSVPRFLNFIIELEPEWNDLNGLTRQHIEKYLEFLQHYTRNNLKSRNANPKRHVLDSVTRVYTFLKDTQRYDYSIAPEKPTVKLLYSDDYPTLDKKSDDDIDYIPDHVLDQLFENINDLHPDVQPIVWVAYKTGLRIGDTLGLTQDCLIRLNGKFLFKPTLKKHM